MAIQINLIEIGILLATLYLIAIAFNFKILSTLFSITGIIIGSTGAIWCLIDLIKIYLESTAKKGAEKA